jgi:DUF438 domain-containing protein
MSEIINNSRKHIDQIKELLQDINQGKDVEKTKSSLKELMGSVPHGEVVAAEQELIAEGFPEEEIIKYCDLHSAALRGFINEEEKVSIPEGHPIDIFKKENLLINRRIEKLKLIEASSKALVNGDASNNLVEVKNILTELTDIDKHYYRKENLLFPFLEKYNITGPPKVMWAKDDEVRGFLKSSIQSIADIEKISSAELLLLFETIIGAAIKAIEEMIYKEEKILFPMSLDTLTENDWYEIYEQSDESGYCLFYPEVKWTSIKLKDQGEKINETSNRIKLSTGSFTREELESFFKTLPVDITFVDKDDKVRFFSEGPDRIFGRSKAIIGRQVQFCHPPSSVHIVERILNDFKSNKENSAKFWINFQGKFVHIAYYAMRSENSEYLGTLEVTQNILEYKSLEGERRILQYE